MTGNNGKSLGLGLKLVSMVKSGFFQAFFYSIPQELFNTRRFFKEEIEI